MTVGVKGAAFTAPPVHVYVDAPLPVNATDPPVQTSAVLEAAVTTGNGSTLAVNTKLYVGFEQSLERRDTVAV